MELFASQFELDCESVDEPYAQKEECETMEVHHTPSQPPLHSGPEILKETLDAKPFRNEDLNSVSTSATNNNDGNNNTAFIDIFEKKVENSNLIEKEEDIEPITKKNVRKWDLKNEIDYGGAIFKAMKRPKKTIQSRISKIVKKIEDDLESMNEDENKNDEVKDKALCMSQGNEINVDSSDTEDTTEAKLVKSKLMKRTLRQNFRMQEISSDRLIYNYSNPTLIKHQKYNGWGWENFQFWPRIHPVKLERESMFHWSKYCYLVMKLASRLIAFNGIDHPQSLQYLSLLYKTPSELAPHPRIAITLIEQYLHGFAIRGRWNNDSKLFQIIDEKNPAEGCYRHTEKVNKIWESMLELKKKELEEIKMKKKAKRKSKVECFDKAKEKVKERNTDSINCNKNEMNSKPKLPQKSKKENPNNEIRAPNEIFDIDFAADFSDDEPADMMIVPKISRKILHLDNVRRHIFMRGIVHYTALDLNIIRLTLSTFLSKLGEERVIASQRFDLSSSAINQVINTCDEILDFLTVCFEQVDRLPKFIYTSTKAITAQMILSFICNSGYGIISQSFDELEENTEISSVRIAGNLQQSVNIYRSIGKLQKFSSIHLTLGIATIAANLGKVGASILAQGYSWSGQKRRTPFDLLKEALEFVDDQRLLRRGGDIYVDDDNMDIGITVDRSNTIDSDKLISALEQAHHLFSTCVNNEPDNVTYLSWHLASVAGIMILSSGITMGKRNKKELRDYQINESYLDEIKFVQYRKLTIEAFKEIQIIVKKIIDKREDGIGPLTQFHLTISAFLEWTDAVCLMIHGFFKNLRALKDLRVMHAWHTSQWALEERTASAMLRIKELYNSREVGVHVIISMQASLLESSMWSRSALLELISHLGTIGRDMDKNTGDQGTKIDEAILKLMCDRSRCPNCAYLVKGAQIDHIDLERRTIHSWWGKDKSWWGSFFFGPLPSLEKFFNHEIGEKELREQMKTLKEQMMIDILDMDLDLDGPYNPMGIGLGNSCDENADHDWMYDEEEEDEYDGENEDEISVTLKARLHNFESNALGTMKDVHCTDNIFPKHINDIVSIKDQRTLSKKAPKTSNTMQGHCIELIAMKIVIAFHLFGVGHTYISSGVNWIAEIYCASVTKNTNLTLCLKQDAYHSLLWLVSMGLDVTKLIFEKALQD